jgi:hypothetical protein
MKLIVMDNQYTFIFRPKTKNELMVLVSHEQYFWVMIYVEMDCSTLNLVTKKLPKRH